MERWVRLLEGASAKKPVDMERLLRAPNAICAGTATGFVVVRSPGWNKSWHAASLTELPFFVAIPQGIKPAYSPRSAPDEPASPWPCVVRLVRDGKQLEITGQRIRPHRTRELQGLRKTAWIQKGGCRFLFLVSHQSESHVHPRNEAESAYTTTQTATLLKVGGASLEYLDSFKLKYDAREPGGMRETVWRKLQWIDIQGATYFALLRTHRMRLPKGKVEHRTHKLSVHRVTRGCELRYLLKGQLRALRQRPGGNRIMKQPADTTTRIK